MTPPGKVLATFGVTDPKIVIQTGIATIWKVQFQGKDAALKVYDNGNTQDEWQGFDLLEAVQGNGTAQLYARTDGAALIEWLDGSSLGDLSRQGNDAQATAQIGRIANLIHRTNVRCELTPLEKVFEALFALKTKHTQPHMAQAQQVARELFAGQTDICALHGDLHHDNIRHSARGYLAFDAKGVRGDRAYDVANVFKNPLDVLQVFGDPDIIAQRAKDLGRILNLTPKRILGWAAAHCALSIVWSGDLQSDPDLHQLQKLLSAYQTH